MFVNQTRRKFVLFKWQIIESRLQVLVRWIFQLQGLFSFQLAPQVPEWLLQVPEPDNFNFDFDELFLSWGVLLIIDNLKYFGPVDFENGAFAEVHGEETGFNDWDETGVADDGLVDELVGAVDEGVVAAIEEQIEIY